MIAYQLYKCISMFTTYFYGIIDNDLNTKIIIRVRIIMDWLTFIKQSITNPRTVGAVLPSSKYLATKIIENIDFYNADCIVEYGPGTGVFTDRILKMRKSETTVLLFESNKAFFNLLRDKFKDIQNFHIIHDSAACIGKYLAMHHIACADYIISGLPFVTLPQEVSKDILKQTKMYLRQNGRFFTYEYSLLKKKFIGQYFNHIEIKSEARNIPPAFVLCCSNSFEEQ